LEEQTGTNAYRKTNNEKQTKRLSLASPDSARAHEATRTTCALAPINHVVANI